MSHFEMFSVKATVQPQPCCGIERQWVNMDLALTWNCRYRWTSFQRKMPGILILDMCKQKIYQIMKAESSVKCTASFSLITIQTQFWMKASQIFQRNYGMEKRLRILRIYFITLAVYPNFQLFFVCGNDSLGVEQAASPVVAFKCR